MGNCYFCGADIDAPVYRSSECPSCGRDCKICLNCEFYSKNSHWECRETIREAVRDKEKSNYCDFFRLSKKKQEKNSNEDSINAFNDLFND